MSVYHEPNFLPFRFAGPTVVSIHDLSWIRYPETHPKERVAIMNRILPLALERVQHVITDSEFIRREVISGVQHTCGSSDDDFACSPQHVHAAGSSVRALQLCLNTTCNSAVIFWSSAPWNRGRTSRPRSEPLPACRKQFGGQFPLVLVGMRGWLTSRLEGELKAPVEREEVRPLGFVTDDELADLYSGATALVYPSLYEGFGLPPLEAMACGTPVITSNVSSLPEVAGNAAVMHDPMDTDALRNAMKRLIDDRAFWLKKRPHRLKQAALFSWERCAKETIAVYRKALTV